MGTEPEVLQWQPGQIANETDWPDWAHSIEFSGGAVQDEGWTIEASQPVAFGRADIILSARNRPHALALTLAFAAHDEVDLSLQLYNASGELLAVDLFGNLAESARVGRTDTFIVPLAQYPEATRVSLRRIRGPLTLHGLLAFPVVTALDEMQASDRIAFAQMLGERLATGGEASPGTIHWQVRETQIDQPLLELLADPGYPEHRFTSPLDAAAGFPAYVSGTCYRFFTNLYLPLFGNAESAPQVAFVSSNSSVQGILRGRVSLALSSYPPSESELAEFEAHRGFRPLVVPIAHDAVEVLVHPGNRRQSIDFATLKRIFSDEVQQREGPLHWDSNTGLTGPIITAGGHPSWGTSRFFADKVLKGEPLHRGLITLDVAFPRGVERFVANNHNAIGFGQHTRRFHAVKALPLDPGTGNPVAANALTVADGTYPLTRHLYLLLAYPSAGDLPEPIRHFADRLLSREGQGAVAAAGSFALPAEQVIQLRAQLGLD